MLVVGQTPPPFGGQAIAIESFVRGSYDGLEIRHVRMAFSASMSDVGRAQLGKLGHLFGLVARVLWARLRFRADVLYYPPAGPDLVPVLRDLVVLLATRWAFARTAFHFHASGLTEIYPRLPAWLRPLFRAAYRRPDLAISPSADNPPDGEFLGARRTLVVPNGIADIAPASPTSAPSGPPRILFVGVLREDKGILVLLEACALLKRRGVEFRLALVGEPESGDFAHRVQQLTTSSGLTDDVELLGVRTGPEKIDAFACSTLFCYPTQFASESFGLVLLEAMQFALPVVATRWRGVPSVVRDGVTGTLVPPGDAVALAETLESLIHDPGTARMMGQRGRARYEAEFTETHFRRRMHEALLGLREENA